MLIPMESMINVAVKRGAIAEPSIQNVVCVDGIH